MKHHASKAFVIDLTPGPKEIANIIAFIQKIWRDGDHRYAFQILSSGWPHMRIGPAWRLLKGDIELEEALTSLE